LGLLLWQNSCGRKGLLRMRTETQRVATISLFREFEAAGMDHERPPSGWEEARQLTSILVDAATPKDGYTSEHAAEVARLSWLAGTDLGLDREGLGWLVTERSCTILASSPLRTRSCRSQAP
jgi:hypothetical protein